MQNKKDLRKVVDKETGKTLFIGSLHQCAEYIAIHKLNEYFRK